MQDQEWNNHSSFTSSVKVQEIVKPLEKIKINYFSYIKQFNDNSRIVLTNFPDWNKYFCNEKYYLRKSSFTNSIDICDDYSQGFILGYKDKYLADIAFNKFKLDRGISLIFKNPNFCEFFHYGTINTEPLGDDFYLNNLINLKQFTLYFREQSSLLSKNADIINFTKNASNLYEDMNLRKNKNFIAIKKLYFYLDNDLKYFTKREVECIYNLLKGYPAKKSADIMSISKRTYDMHLENIKDKLHCQKNSQIIFILAKIGLLNTIVNIDI